MRSAWFSFGFLEKVAPAGVIENRKGATDDFAMQQVHLIQTINPIFVVLFTILNMLLVKIA